MLKKLFMDKLPNGVSRLLAATGETDLDILAERADDIVATPTTTTTSFLRAKNVWNNYPRHKNELCFHHDKFGHNTNKCVSPCNWQGSREGQSKFHQDFTNPNIDKVGAIGPFGSLIKVHEPITKIDFLVDTGSTISLLPNCSTQPVSPASCLRAINDPPVPIYGTQKLRICLNLPETLSWTFTIADVRTAVLGIDFSSHYGL